MRLIGARFGFCRSNKYQSFALKLCAGMTAQLFLFALFGVGHMEW